MLVLTSLLRTGFICTINHPLLTKSQGSFNKQECPSAILYRSLQGGGHKKKQGDFQFKIPTESTDSLHTNLQTFAVTGWDGWWPKSSTCRDKHIMPSNALGITGSRKHNAVIIGYEMV